MATVIEDEVSIAKSIESPTTAAGNTLQSNNSGQDIPSVKTSPASTATAKKPNSFIKTAVMSVISLTAVGGAAAWWLHASSVEETDDAFVTGHVHQLSSRVSGTVVKVAVDDNEHVKLGQLLVKIDPHDYEISAESAKAAAAKAEWQAVEAQSTTVGNARQADAQRFQADSAVASAKAQINRAKESLTDARLGVILSKTQIQQRQSELTRATSDFVRYQDLVRDRAVTTQSFERAKQDKEVAEANLAAAQATYDQALVKVKEAQQSVLDTETSSLRAMGTVQTAAAAHVQTETSKRTVDVQKSAARQAQAEYDNALTQLNYTNIMAPISGKIGHKTVEIGQQIERGQALMSVVSDQKWVVANYKETQLGRMKVGQDVDVKIDSFDGKHFKGKVESMSPASGAQFSMLPPDNATGNFTKVVQRVAVKVVLDPASIGEYADRLTPGMSVVCEVKVSP